MTLSVSSGIWTIVILQGSVEKMSIFIYVYIMRRTENPVT